jgi:hypothetical protein
MKISNVILGIKYIEKRCSERITILKRTK